MMARGRRALARTVGGSFVALALLSAASKHAHATYSVTLADRTTGVVAVGVASCVPLDVVQKVAGLARGKGAFVTQSYLYAPAHDEAARGMTLGEAPAVILPRLLDPKFDADAELRQYALVSLAGESAAHTGARTLDFAGHRTYVEEGVVVTFQGNVLAGEATLEAMRSAFVTADGAALDRLVAALVAPSKHAPVLGDARCTARGRSAEAATLDVLAADPRDDLHVAVEGGETDEPLRAVSEKYAAYRRARAADAAAPLDASPSPPEGAELREESTGCTSAAGPKLALPFAMTLLAGILARRRRCRSA